MHLTHPSLTTTGKRRGKAKFRSSAQAQKSKQAKKDWQDLKDRWGATDSSKKEFKPLSSNYQLRVPADRDPRNLGKSVDTGTGDAFRSADKVYTGDKMIGVAVMHKSCLQPIFTEDQARDSASMRR